MKRKTLIFLMLVLLILSGCRLENNQTITPIMTKIQNETVAVRLRDVVEHRFTDDLSLTLTEEEKTALLQTIATMEEKEDHFGGYLMYALDFIDADGNLLTTLYVDNDITIEAADGDAYLRSGAIAQALDHIESAYTIRDQLYNRKPGSGYFLLLPQADHGCLYEITENNFIEGIEKNISKTEISALADALTSFSVSEYPTQDLDIKYILELYSADGGLYYKFFLDGAGRPFTNEYYEIQSDDLTSLVAGYIEEAAEKETD